LARDKQANPQVAKLCPVLELPGPAQHAVLTLLTSGDLERHMRQILTGAAGT
jgi:hypothetical protein